MSHNEGYHRKRGAWQPNDRQRQVLDALVEGKSNAEIAVRLGITMDGAKWHVGVLLGETGLKDRQALAAWWRVKRQKRGRSALVLLTVAWRAVALAGGVAGVLAIAGWFVFGRESGGGNETNRPPVDSSPAIDEGYLSSGPIRPFEPLFGNFLVELAFETGNGESRVDLRDIKTGRLLGSVEAGYRPMVVVRKQAEELLVSSGLGSASPEEGFNKVVQVYDLHDGSLALKRTIEVPERVNCTTYCQPMVLSMDERYLYYAARTTALECGEGGDAAVCDVHSVVAVDLVNPVAPPVSTELQRGCGVPTLNAAGASGAVVSCTGQYPVPGGWTRLIEPDGGGSTLDLDANRSLFNAFTSDGSVVLFTESGGVTKYAPDGQQMDGFALPSSSDLGFRPRLFYVGSQVLGGDRVFLVFDDSDSGAHDRKYGFVIFDVATMQIEGYGRVPGALSYVPQGESVYVLRGGRIEVLDLATGRLDVLAAAAGSGAEVLLPGR
jgi:DNA-binding CsgD family transcriptional regulator